MQVTRIGMDIAKQIFELHGVDRRELPVLRRTVTRARLLEFLTRLKPCTIGMEACGGAHYWYREISRLGHTVQLLPAHKVKPYVDGNKNNRHDAAAICEAMSRLPGTLNPRANRGLPTSCEGWLIDTDG